MAGRRKAPANRFPTEEYPLSKLSKMECEYNPRRNMTELEFEMLKAGLSIGVANPLTLNRRSKAKGWPARSRPVIVGGHKRVLAALDLGWKTFPVGWMDLTPKQERAVNSGLNRIAADFDPYLETVNVQAMVEMGMMEAEFLAAGYATEDVAAIVEAATGDAAAALDEFSEADESTNRKCPKCGYEWSE